MRNFKEISKQYNEIRESFANDELSKKDVCELISFIPNGVRNNFTTVQKFGLVNKIDNGKYKFPEKPVYWEAVKNCSEAMKSLNKKYTDKYLQKKREKSEKPILKGVPIPDGMAIELITSEEDMINYLLKTGKYRILKKKIEWEELK